MARTVEVGGGKRGAGEKRARGDLLLRAPVCEGKTPFSLASTSGLNPLHAPDLNTQSRVLCACGKPPTRRVDKPNKKSRFTSVKTKHLPFKPRALIVHTRYSIIVQPIAPLPLPLYTPSRPSPLDLLEPSSRQRVTIHADVAVRKSGPLGGEGAAALLPGPGGAEHFKLLQHGLRALEDLPGLR